MSSKEFSQNEHFSPFNTKFEAAKYFIENNIIPITARKKELTEREKEIIAEILGGMNLKQIAENKNIAQSTVYQKLMKIKNKLYGGSILKNLDFEDLRDILIYTHSLTTLT
jgi:DNA-binding NarL/FixJ family response regulator